MKTCVILLLVFVALFINFQANAADLAIVVGLKTDSATANNTAIAVDSRSGYNAGMLGYFELGPQILLRFGMVYTPRTYGLAAGDVKLTYVDIPVGLMWKFSDYGGVYASANAAMNVSAACPTSCANLANVANGYQFGFNFKFAPHMGGVIYYEAMSSLVVNIENPKAVAAQFLYTFE